MTPPRAIGAVLAATAVVGGGASTASASTPAIPLPTGVLPFLGTTVGAGPVGAGGSQLSGACGTSTGQHGQGAAGGTATQVCTGAGLTLVAPQVGQVASVVGPTVIGPAIVISITSAGDGAIG
jgi:hypothetical protein